MTKKELLDRLRKLAKKLGTKTIKQQDIKSGGLEYWVRKHYRYQADAIKEADLLPTPLAEKMSVSEDELLDYLNDLKAKGKKPTTLEITRDGRFSWKIFKTRFGSLKEALRQLDEKNIVLNKKDSKHNMSSSFAEKDLNTFNKTKHNGRAAELHVTAELIYHGFQAGDIPIDEGLDILAWKNNKTYLIQVKHKNLANNQSVSITKSSYEKTGGGDVYYIFVLLSGKQRNFLIVPFHTINDWRENGWLSEEDMAYLLKIKEENGRFKIINKDSKNELDVTRFIDTWDQIR